MLMNLSPLPAIDMTKIVSSLPSGERVDAFPPMPPSTWTVSSISPSSPLPTLPWTGATSSQSGLSPATLRCQCAGEVPTFAIRTLITFFAPNSTSPKSKNCSGRSSCGLISISLRSAILLAMLIAASSAFSSYSWKSTWNPAKTGLWSESFTPATSLYPKSLTGFFAFHSTLSHQAGSRRFWGSAASGEPSSPSPSSLLFCWGAPTYWEVPTTYLKVGGKVISPSLQPWRISPEAIPLPSWSWASIVAYDPSLIASWILSSSHSSL
mmetsp:Transcript_8788/g.31687  ORF Transcript_8788/g.31687 Transcript_8788/m.31687 type:complete len:266 (-) Transcript_8788:1092-1889(-)